MAGVMHTKDAEETWRGEGRGGPIHVWIQTGGTGLRWTGEKTNWVHDEPRVHCIAIG